MIKRGIVVIYTKSELRELCKPPGEGKAYYRPFICKGDINNIQIFLVGINPATPIYPSDMGLDEYLDKILDYDAFLNFYKDNRRKHGKPELSRTREAINSFVNWLGTKTQVSVAETNIIPYLTVDLKHLNHEDNYIKDRGRTLFLSLFNRFQPSLIITHGKVTVKEILNLFNTNNFIINKEASEYLLDMDYLNTDSIHCITFPDGKNCSIISFRHFRFYGANGEKSEEFRRVVERVIKMLNL